MSVRRPWLLALIGAACVVAACTPSAAPPTSVPPTESLPAEVRNLPPGCDPIDLRSPDGQAVDLNGIWIQGGEGGGTPATWWIRTVGDCIWGTGIFDDYAEGVFAFEYSPDAVQGLQGRMGDDFVIDSTIVFLGPCPCGVQYLAEARIIIDFDDDGQIILREDREPGAEGPRCPVFYCPDPLVLRRSG